MTDAKKKWLGLGSFGIFLFIPIFVIVIFLTAFLGGDAEFIIGPIFAILFLLYFLVGIATFALWIYYIIDVFQNPNVEEDNRVMWVIALVIGGALVMPVYWWLNIWKGEFPDKTETIPGIGSGQGFDQRVADVDEFKYGQPKTPAPMSWRDPD